MATIVGAGGGWATVSEYTAVVPATFIALLAVACARSGNGRRLGRVIAYVTVGALVCAGILAIVNTLSFGGPLELGYSNVVGFEGMTRGFFGLTRPNPETLRALLFGQYRGLFFFAPVLALAPIGFALLVRDRSSRGPAIAALAIAVSLRAAQRVLRLLGRRVVLGPSTHGGRDSVHESRPCARMVPCDTAAASLPFSSSRYTEPF